ncbi:LysE family transporter [Candidatus Sororendozoicomonas aggregata]|uniref:LysE family transporter n=1 Tax=Candidatus Sororendozoicomonas aggregata TaxID=3073239 RepID=UPI003B75CB8B
MCLGIKIFFEPRTHINKDMDSLHPLSSKIFLRSFWISMGNPKIILFLISLFPAFIEQEYNQTVQLVILSLIFVFLLLAPW